MGEAWQQVLAESGTSVRGKRTVLRWCVDPALLQSGEQRSLQNRIGLCAVARDPDLRQLLCEKVGRFAELLIFPPQKTP